MIGSIGYAASTASNYGTSSYSQSMNALRSKWSTQLAKASLGELGFEVQRQVAVFDQSRRRHDDGFAAIGPGR